MTRIFFFRDPEDYSFAHAARRGTWFPNPGRGVCPDCGVSSQRIVSPLILEWQPDSDVVGDFMLTGLMDCLVVTQRVRDVLEREFCGFEFGPVEMFQEPKLKRPDRPTKRTKPRVWLPYEGPPLWHLLPTSTCELDLERSGVLFLKTCPKCGTRFHKSPPSGQRSLVVDVSTWGAADIFQIAQYPGLIYCTERVKNRIESEGFTTVFFQLDGEIPDHEVSIRLVGERPGQASLAPMQSEAMGGSPVTNDDHDSGGSNVSKGAEGGPSGSSDSGGKTPSGSRMPTYDEMPEDNEDLAKVEVSFPYLADNSAESCPVPMQDILDYLGVEVPEDSPTGDDLQFLRTAQVGEQSYWIWRFTDSEEDEYYVTVSIDPEGTTTTGCDVNYYGLSPEQYMLGVYHEVF